MDSSHDGAIRGKNTGNRTRNRMDRPQAHIRSFSRLVLIGRNQTEDQMIHVTLRNRPVTPSPALLVRNPLFLYTIISIHSSYTMDTTYETKPSNTPTGSSPPSDHPTSPEREPTPHN